MTENNHLDVVARLAIHEAVCAERYREVRDSLETIQRFLNRATWTIGSGLASSSAGSSFGSWCTEPWCPDQGDRDHRASQSAARCNRHGRARRARPRLPPAMVARARRRAPARAAEHGQSR
jgi:hypothetical protein